MPCVIVNPRSFRAARGGLAARAEALARRYGAEVLLADHPAQIASGLDRALAAGTERIFVLSGDGTVQAIADYLAALPAGTVLPQLLVLGGGRTNLTAADLGGCGELLAKLEAALQRCRDGGAFRIETRELLTMEQAPARSRHGFFVAAGFVDSAIRACHQHRDSGRGPLRTGHLSTFWYLAKLAVLSLLGRCPIPYPQLRIDAPGCGRLDGASRVLIATTLQHREGLFNPYAARGQGALRLTAVTAAASGFWLWLPRILLGRFGEHLVPAHGYLSGRCERVEVLGMTGYSLDGEEFDTDPARPVHLRTGARIEMLLP